MENQRHNDEKIMFMLGEITAEVKGINIRLDRVNGRLDKNDDKIDIIEKYQNTQIGKLSIISIIMGAIFGIVGAFIREKLF